MTTRILFINAINEAKEVETRYPALGIGYLISSLRMRFGAERFVFRVADRDVEDQLAGFAPDIVGISSVSQNYGRACAYAKAAKQRGIPVLCGGVHITMLPESLAEAMDVGVVGEAEETVCALLDIYLEQGGFDPRRLHAVNGIVFRDGGKLIRTPPRDLVRPLDNIPLPAREFFDIKPNTYVFSSRGCPYRCTFCASARFWNKVRMFSARYVADEIEFLMKSHGVKEINFFDDIFSVDVKRVRELLRLFRERGMLGKIKISCSIRANLVNDETVSLLKEIGVEDVGIGFESGSESILKYLKVNVTMRDNENAVAIMRKHGMRLVGSFIIGSPQESKEDILATYRFIKKSRLADFNLYVLTPFPGTPAWDYALSRGLVSEQMDWERLNVDFSESHESAIILSEKLTREQLFSLYTKIMNSKKTNRFVGLARALWQDPLLPARAAARRIGVRRASPANSAGSGSDEK